MKPIVVCDVTYRDLDFNPNKQYYMATCGDDGYSRFWDVRNPSEPVVARADHSHW
jgi:WD40 repeat protein